MKDFIKYVLGVVGYRLESVSKSQRFEQLVREGTVIRGRHTYGVPSVQRFPGSETKLVMGNFVSIADGATFVLGGIHPVGWVSTYPLRAKLGLHGAFQDGMPSSNGDIVLGSDVWCAHGVTVLSGVNVGHGAVLCAGAVVTRDIPAYAIAAGVPARVVRKRFSEPDIEALLRLQWWNWPDDKVMQYTPLLSSSALSELLALVDLHKAVV